MATIIYDKSTTLGGMVGSLVSGTYQMKFLASRLKSLLDEAIVNNNYAQIESFFSLTPGTGEAFYTAVTTITTALNTIDSLPSLDQG